MQNDLDIAMGFLVKKEYDSAYQIIQKKLSSSLKRQDFQQAATCNLLLGHAYWTEKKLSKALKAFQNGETLLPSDPDQKVSTAYFYLIGLGKKRMALQKAEEVLRLDSKKGFATHRAFQLKGLLHFDRKEFEKAVEMLLDSTKVRHEKSVLTSGYEMELVKKLVASGNYLNICKQYLELALQVAKKGKGEQKQIKTLLANIKGQKGS